MFTYNGGLLFTARVFGTSSLERVNFQLRKRSYWCIKQRSNAELGSDNARIPKRQKTLKTSKDRHSSHTSENIHLLKEIEVDPSDFPKANANESDSVFEEVREDSSFGWKFPHQISNTKKPNEGLKLDSLLTWCVNSDPKIAKELDVVSDTDIVMLDGRNHEAFVNESITNSATSEQRTVCLIGDGTPEPEITGKPWSMTNFAPSWEINEHVENKKRSAEMNDCQIPDGEIDCRMKINRTMEKKHSNSPELPSAESLEEMMATECNLKHEKDSPKMEVNLTEPEGIACEVLHAAGLFHTFNEKSTKQVIPSDPSTDILRFTEDVKKDVMPTVERYEEHQSKGESVKQEAFTNEDAKDVTPSSGWRSPIEMERTDLIEIPASGCASFTVCILDDVQPSLELPENLASHIGKLKHERKVFVLQDPSFKCWPVLYLESLDYVGFIGGWIDFAIGNNICKGDICKFELIDKKKLLFRVQIRKE
ncbi:hypothetical protein HPP92_026956 [Vanilla planifolia]|uniref:TF-B3 domain-containing protein n=1 Tax=Vanilla planifolia TaxID=51239 RepID=A0A835PCT4_VANPL|nr:hypothetical protein HPP92_026956 [Vanilla planifolia]